jgi:hypothetical protein
MIAVAVEATLDVNKTLDKVRKQHHCLQKKPIFRSVDDTCAASLSIQTRNLGQMQRWAIVVDIAGQAKPIPSDRHVLIFQVAGSLRHFQLTNSDNGGNSGNQLVLSLWNSVGGTQWPEP